jgi:hypothetical protein
LTKYFVMFFPKFATACLPVIGTDGGMAERAFFAGASGVAAPSAEEDEEPVLVAAAERLVAEVVEATQADTAAD